MTRNDAATDPSLTDRIVAALDTLGGRSAVAARRFGPAPKRQLPMASRSDHGDSFHDHADHEHGVAPLAVEESVTLHEDDVFPAASLAKLPIAVELLRRADMGQFSLNERFDTSAEPRVGGGGVLDYLDPQTLLTLNDLAFLMIGISDNTAANFLLDVVGMGEVNETLNRLNLTHTKLARRFMDWGARASHRDNVTSASDILALLALIRGRALPGATRLRELLAAQQLADDITSCLPESAQLAHKSGSLDGVFHDAGLLSGPGGSCAYCVLTADQQDVSAARIAVGRVIRILWDAWRLD